MQKLDVNRDSLTRAMKTTFESSTSKIANCIYNHLSNKKDSIESSLYFKGRGECRTCKSEGPLYGVPKEDKSFMYCILCFMERMERCELLEYVECNCCKNVLEFDDNYMCLEHVKNSASFHKQSRTAHMEGKTYQWLADEITYLAESYHLSHLSKERGKPCSKCKNKNKKDYYLFKGIALTSFEDLVLCTRCFVEEMNIKRDCIIQCTECCKQFDPLLSEKCTCYHAADDFFITINDKPYRFSFED